MCNRLIIILMSTFLFGACTNEVILDDEPQKEGVLLNLAINSLSINDPMSVNQDQTFSSLAIYIYNNDVNYTLDKSLLLSSFSPVNSKDILIEGTIGTKTLYLIANYNGKTFKQTDGTPLTLNLTTTKQQLDNIITETSSSFMPASLLMVGKQILNITEGDNGTEIGVLLRRLQARVDVHVFKGQNFGTNSVTLESVEFHNQVLNSEMKFDYDASSVQMLTSPIFNTQLIVNNSVLSPYVNGTVLQPSNSQAIFYSYQNLITTPSSLPVTAPYLVIKLNEGGTVHTYKGYFTDNNQVANKYSLLQNNVYQITAILDIDSKITMNLNVLPWNKKNIEYERPITSNDFLFGAWGTSWGGINGKTMNTNVGSLEDAVFEFELKAPFGSKWTATLTNGLDFAFSSSTAGTSTVGVSNGFANIGTKSLIVVRATKRWTGDVRDTELYITVEGNEVPINPIIGSQRMYEGTDTRIKIRQVASY